MLGRPIATAPLATLLPGLAFGTQTLTVRYASESFITRSGDSPSNTHISGRINRGLEIGRQLTEADDGQFGSLIDARFGEVVLNNEDGALDSLITDYYADGRPIRLYIGAKEVEAPGRVMPRWIATGDGAASGNAAIPYSMDYPTDGVLPGDLFVIQVTINDRGEAGQLSSVPEPWEVLAETSSGPLYQALLYHFATGTEAGESAAVNWESGDDDNDCIVGRIHQFRYVDIDQPFEAQGESAFSSAFSSAFGGGGTPIVGDLDSIDLPTVTTLQRNTLATYWVSWSDNVNTSSPSGATGGIWENIGNIVSTSTADDAANRRAGAEMVEPGTISGGSISTAPTDSPFSEVSLIVGVAMRGLPTSGGRERVQPLADFALVYSAVAGPWSTDRPEVVRLEIQTLASRLQDRLQALTYAGTGGQAGTADMAGRTLPLAFGRCLNVPAQLVDPAELIYQVHSGSIEAITAVFDQAVEVPFDADYPNYAALAAASVPPGFYSSCLAEGYLKLGTVPTGAVTANVQGDNSGGYVDTHAGIIRRILINYSQLTTANLDEDSFTAADLAQPAEIQIYFEAGDQSTVEEAVERVAFSGGFYAGQDRSGLYRIGQLAKPAMVQHWTFDFRDIIEIERLPPAYGVPWKAWGVGYRRNWTVQRGAEVAAAVSQERRQFLESEYRHVYMSNAAIALSHSTSTGSPLRPSLFLEASDAEAEAARLLEFYALGRALYRVVVKTVLFSAEIGQTVRLIYPRWNLGAGRNCVVVSVADDAARRVSEMLVFG